jgi:cytochrome P450
MEPRCEKKLREEFKSKFKSYGVSNAELVKEIDLNSIEELDYLKMCFYETLRLEPPVPFSSTVMITEDQKLGNINVKGGERIILNMHQLGHNPHEW